MARHPDREGYKRSVGEDHAAFSELRYMATFGVYFTSSLRTISSLVISLTGSPSSRARKRSLRPEERGPG
jgi:hypothetical protein